MGEVLSQNEIDSLLKALSSGELDVDEIKDDNEKQVKTYDFARPAKFSKEHLRTLWKIAFNESAGVPKKKCSGGSDEFGGGDVFRVCECTIESGAAWNCKFCSAE